MMDVNERLAICIQRKDLRLWVQTPRNPADAASVREVAQIIAVVLAAYAETRVEALELTGARLTPDGWQQLLWPAADGE